MLAKKLASKNIDISLWITTSLPSKITNSNHQIEHDFQKIVNILNTLLLHLCFLP